MIKKPALFFLFSLSSIVFAYQHTENEREFPVQTHGVCKDPASSNVFDPTFRGADSWSYAPGGSCTIDIQNAPIRKLKQEGGAKPRDSKSFYSVGVNPANLTPEGIDLNVFPEFPIGDHLVLKPGLSYGADNLLEKRGLLLENSFKQWQSHFGEIVRIIPRQDRSGDEAINGETYDENGVWENGTIDPHFIGTQDTYDAMPTEVHTFFVNATGEQVNFFPDPLDRNTAILASTWYSNEGNFRLSRITDPADSHGLSDIDLKLESPDGLIFYFKAYRAHGSHKIETVSLHYRTHRIYDRHGNYIEINYRGNEHHTGLQPTTATSYFSNHALFQTMEYHYDNSGRLTKIRVPNYRTFDYDRPAEGTSGNLTNGNHMVDFEFHYPTEAHLHEKGATCQITENNGKYAMEPLASNIQAFIGPELFTDDDQAHLTHKQNQSVLVLDLTEVGYLPSVVDFSNAFYQESPTFDPAPYYVKVNDSWYVLKTDRANGSIEDQESSREHIFLRYQLDQNKLQGYLPPGNSKEFEALVLEHLSGPELQPQNPGTFMAVNVSIYPPVKEGDMLVQDGQVLGFLARENNDFKLYDSNQSSYVTFNPEDITFQSQPVSNKPIYWLREDNANRIAEIKFPFDGTNRYIYKLMQFQYDDRSHNHQEISKVSVFDNNNGSPVLLQETTYDFEIVRTLTGHADLSEVLPPKDILGPQAGTGADGLPPSYVKFFQACDQGDRIWDFNNLRVGLIDKREKEVNTLRKKTTRYLVDPEQNTYSDQVWYYGGKYRYFLATSADKFFWLDDPYSEPLGSAYADCKNVQWTLDGRLFEFTYIVQPDGSGSVFDLNPDGLGMPEFLAGTLRGNQPLKTYQFDNHFIQEVQMDAESALTNKPFYTRMPQYISDAQKTIAQAAATPEDTLFNPFSLDLLFQGNSKCFGVNMVSMEPVPRFPYTFRDHYMVRDTLKTTHGQFISSQVLTLQPEEQLDFHIRSSGIRSLIKGAVAEVTYDTSNQPQFPDSPGPSFQGDPFTDTGIILDPRRVQNFFDGKLYTTVCAENSPNGNASGTIGCAEGWPNVGHWNPMQNDLQINHGFKFVIQWKRGGQTDLGNYLQPYYNFSQMFSFKPSVTWQAINYEGFQWDADKKMPSINAKDMVSITKNSNGGYLGLANATASASVNTRQLSLDQLPAGISPGDVLIHDKLFYTVDSIGSYVFISPTLRSPIEPGDKIQFYRYFNPTYSGSDKQIAVTNGYQGYTSFAESTYKSVKADFSDWVSANTPVFRPSIQTGTIKQGVYDLFALPRDFAADQIEAKENLRFGSTAQERSYDFQTWQFFGKTFKTWQGNTLPFSQTFSGYGLPEGPIFVNTAQEYVFVSEVEYDAEFPWLPKKTIDYALPANQWQEGKPVTPAPHPQDMITEYVYYGSSEPSIKAGRLKQTLTYRRDDGYQNGVIHTAVVEKVTYDQYGRLQAKESAAFQGGNAPYGQKQVFVRDGNSGLPIQEQVFKGSAGLVGNILTLSSLEKLSHSYKLYDSHGRVIEALVKDPSGQIFGPIATYQYPTLSETLVSFKDHQGNLLRTERTINNGLGQPILETVDPGAGGASVSKTKNGQKVDQTSQDYRIRTYYDQAGRVVAKSTAFLDEHYQGTGHSYVLYNEFGQETARLMGNSPFNPYFSPSSYEQAIWSFQKRTDGLSYTYQVDKSTVMNQTGINVKAFVKNGLGHLISVRDYRIEDGRIQNILQGNSAYQPYFFLAPNDVQTNQDIHPANLSYTANANTMIAFCSGLTDADLVAKVDYQFDRLGNVIEAINGIEGNQQRLWQYDRFNRLTFEYQPEIGQDIWFSDFTLGGKPRRLVHGSEQSPVQTQTFTYDAFDNILETSTAYRNGVDYHQLFEYGYQHGDWRLADLMVFARGATRNLDIQGNATKLQQAVAYRYDYDGNTQLLTRRGMSQGHSNRFPGYQTNPTYESLADGVSSVMNLRYQYNNLGFLTGQTYPEGPAGSGTATQLAFNYQNGSDFTARMQSMTDTALSLSLVENIKYGPNDIITSYLVGSHHQVNRVLDPLNRVIGETVENGFDRQERQWGFDLKGNVSAVTTRTGYDQIKEDRFYYGYDGLNQLIRSDITIGGGQGFSVNYRYQYDSKGLGNLVARHEVNGAGNTQIPNTLETGVVDFSNNHLKTAAFDNLGRMNNFDGKSWRYDDSGRPYSMTLADGQKEVYRYDPFGLRTFKILYYPDGTMEQILYFYDEANKVLTEWRALTYDILASWDRNYIYFSGQTLTTYEADPIEAQGQLPPANVLELQVADNGTPNPIVSWDGGNSDNFEVEFIAADGTVVCYLTGYEDTQTGMPGHITYGSYFIRVRATGGFWSRFIEVHYLDSVERAELTYVGFADSIIDTSRLQRKVESSAAQFAAEGDIEYVNLQPGETVTVKTPFSGTEGRLMTMGVKFKSGADNTGQILDIGGKVGVQINGSQLTVNVLNESNNQTQITLDSWNELAVTFSFSLVRFYLNGQLIAYYDLVGSVLEDDVRLGTTTQTLQLDELRIYRDARSVDTLFD